MSELEAVQRLVLRHDGRVTDVVVGTSALAEMPTLLAAWWRDRAVFLLASREVDRLHGERVRSAIAGAARVDTILVPDGEGAKSVGEADRLWQALMRRGAKRDSRLVALGGGSVTDVGAFVAGTFLRGIEVALVPTTLLGQVDAAIGGKAGIDLPGAKNAVGLFVPPRAVIADTGLLATLPEPELRSGLFEVIKMATLLRPSLLDLVEHRLGRLLAGDPEALAPVVAEAVAAKAEIVEEDFREGDRRRLLNFGHTLAHAIEAEQQYAGLRHGEAVGYGMLFALRLGCAAGLDLDVAERVHLLIRRLGLPPLTNVALEGLWEAMARDKKAREGGLIWVLPVALGRGRMVPGIPEEAIRSHLAAFLEAPLAPPGEWELEPRL